MNNACGDDDSRDDFSGSDDDGVGYYYGVGDDDVGADDGGDYDGDDCCGCVNVYME